jgi:hypothetical protein
MESEDKPSYFAENAEYGIVSVKCHDGRFYFIKHKRSGVIRGKSLDLGYLEGLMNEQSDVCLSSLRTTDNRGS